MGNPDVVIIINGEIAFIVRGHEYEGLLYKQALQLGIEKFGIYMAELKTFAEHPDEIDDCIRKIEIFEIRG